MIDILCQVGIPELIHSTPTLCIALPCQLYHLSSHVNHRNSRLSSSYVSPFVPSACQSSPVDPLWPRKVKGRASPIGLSRRIFSNMLCPRIKMTYWATLALAKNKRERCWCCESKPTASRTTHDAADCVIRLLKTSRAKVTQWPSSLQEGEQHQSTKPRFGF